MKLWESKEKHKICGKREVHMVKIIIPTIEIHYIRNGIEMLNNVHYVPLTAILSIQKDMWNVWLRADWIILPSDEK